MKFEIETRDDNSLKKVKGGKTHPILLIKKDAELDHAWFEEDKSIGSIVECKCGDFFFISLDSNTGTYKIGVDEMTGGLAMLYCETCREGSVTKSAVCSTCGK
ncbi:hypothetical protein EU522_00060, partial [Candidatus Thorarchaeota archaeon]